jgi:8-oxo-dGTP pyrophosphatase MutT (NUDIX family)
MSNANTDGAVLVHIRVYPDGYKSKINLEDGEPEASVPIGAVFVIDENHRNPLYKLAGGGIEHGESALKAAIEEAVEETGIYIKAENITEVGSWNVEGRSRKHKKHLFVADVEEKDLGSMGSTHARNEGEKPVFFTNEQFHELVRNCEFMPEHYKKLVQYTIILPIPAW